jgi:glyoxylase-like metal-dependent hydrolase (beta-lactamase superfamily II)
LHTDHAGGLHHFPRARILVARAEYQQAYGRAGRLRGYVPQHWPAWFAPELIDVTGQPLGPFPASHPLTQDGDVLLVPTPGHSAGHLSVLLRESERTVAFAGDLSYSQGLLLAGAVDGVAPDEQQARASMRQMVAYMTAMPTVYLPSHDPDAARRLGQREICAIPAPAALQSAGVDEVSPID